VDTVLAVLLLITAVVTVAYWVDFFVHGSVNVVDAEWYIRFQRAIPAADVFMAISCAVSAIGLLAGSPVGVGFALVAAGALLFLGLLDVLFNIDNGLYAHLRSSWPMRGELVINLWCLAFGGVLLGAMLGRV
jgi:hypothetical protein